MRGMVVAALLLASVMAGCLTGTGGETGRPATEEATASATLQEQSARQVLQDLLVPAPPDDGPLLPPDPPSPALLPSGRAWMASAWDPRALPGGHCLAGCVYYYGGLLERGSQPRETDQIVRFDPLAGLVVLLDETLPDPRSGAVAAYHDGRIFVFGGVDTTGMPGADPNAEGAAGGPWDQDTIFVHDPLAGTVETDPLPLPGPRARMAVAQDGPLVYLAGGETPDGLVADLLVFDADTRRFLPPLTLPDPIFKGAAAVSGDACASLCLYYFGGRTATARSDAIVEVDLATGSTRTLEDRLPTWYNAMAAAEVHGKVILLGGWGGVPGTGNGQARLVDEVSRFDPASGRLVVEAVPLLVPRTAASATAAGPAVFLAGGTGEDNVRRADIQLFVPLSQGPAGLVSRSVDLGETPVRVKLFVDDLGLDEAAGAFAPSVLAGWQPAIDAP